MQTFLFYIVQRSKVKVIFDKKKCQMFGRTLICILNVLPESLSFFSF